MNTHNTLNPYLTQVSQLAARVLSMLNRNSMSLTYGCFDRNFWHFKTISDFPCATYQQVVLGLSRLFVTKREGNGCYGQPVVGDAVRTGILFWCKIQHRDGSFDEYYENERSFCATAFTTYAVAQAYFHTRALFTAREGDIISKGLLKAALWLSARRRSDVSNQMIASMNALYWVFKVTGQARIKDAFAVRRSEVIASQNSEGWFPEYGGADIGYSFKVLDLLSSYLAEEDDGELMSSAVRLADFINGFLHPDGTCGGEYGSRCTQHVFPHGIEFLGLRNVIPAKRILAWFRENMARNLILQPSSVDDKYAAYFYFNSYVEAFLIHKHDNESGAIPAPAWPSAMIFKNAGLIRLQNGPITAWFSIRRKGTCRIFYNKELLYSDCGYELRASDGALYATQYVDDTGGFDHFENAEGININFTGHAGRVDDSLPLTNWIIPFKLFCRSLLRIDMLAYWFSDRVKFTKIVKRHRSPISLKRQFIFNKERLVIKDIVKAMSSRPRIEECRLLRDTTLPHSPSSRNYQIQSFLPRQIPLVKRESGKLFEYEYEIPYER